MGLFSRKTPQPKPVIEQRNDDVQEYTIPVALSFLKEYASMQPTALSAVYAATELISKSLAAIPIHIRDKQTGQLVENHSLNTVFRSGLITRFMLIKCMVHDMLLYGNGLCYIERAADGTVIDLIYCPHSSYTIQYNEQSRKLFYIIPSIKKGRVEPINVLHIYKDAQNGVVGNGLMTYADRTIRLASATENSAKDYFESGCAVNGILKSSKMLTAQQKIDIKQSWSQAFQNGQNGSSIAVLGADIDYIATGANATDSQMLETREFNITEIARFFNVSPQLIGDLSHTQYGSLEQAQLDFVIHTLSPYIQLLEDEFNRKLLKPSEFNLHIDFDEEHMLLADKSATANYYSTLVDKGILTRNEARHALGFSPIEGGDKLIVAYTDVASNTIGEKNTQNEDGKEK